MKWSGRDRDGEKRGYHHGNLKAALMEAALRLIAEKGPDGLTLAEIARLARVSPAAPYRHFKDREALLVEVAKRGFEVFSARLEAAWNQGSPTPGRAFENVGRAYLGFAREEPAYFAAMFEAGLSAKQHPDLQTAGDRAFGVLRAAAESLAAGLPGREKAPAAMIGLHVWALSHGIAALFAKSGAVRPPFPASPEELLESGVLIYLRGLGLMMSERAK